jgi:hypothetical protein
MMLRGTDRRRRRFAGLAGSLGLAAVSSISSKQRSLVDIASVTAPNRWIT